MFDEAFEEAVFDDVGSSSGWSRRVRTRASANELGLRACGISLLLMASAAHGQTEQQPVPTAAPAENSPAPATPDTTAAAPGSPPAAPVAAAPGTAAAAQQGTWIPSPDGKSYTWVPAGYQPPPILPYREGKPIPPGYRLEERPRRGAVITGFVLTGIPYGIGLIAAYSSDFVNKSGYMLVPWAGPWLTMGLRDWHDCDSTDADGATDAGLDCGQDVLVFMGLLIDGMVQLAGGITLAIGYAAKKQVLVYQQSSTFHISPSRVGSGYGLNALGTF